MEQSSQEASKCNPLQAQEDRIALLTDMAPIPNLKCRVVSSIIALLSCALAGVLMAKHQTTPPSATDPHLKLLDEAEVSSILDHKTDCWRGCGNIAGDCPLFCGAGKACCRRGWSLDPPECHGVTNFQTRHHECVTPVVHVPVKHQKQNCWRFCGGKGGRCEWCGSGNLCCRHRARWDPPVCRSVVNFQTKEFHTCVKSEKPNPSHQGTLTFYMYRAQSDDNYLFENVNAANIAGVLRYLHDEVVASCPRKFQITRIIRFKITMRATDALSNKTFGPFVAFDKGKCTVPNCPQLWSEHGYVVGCQKQGTSVAHYRNGVWYSVPGPCPSQEIGRKFPECRRTEPGGHCNNPDGSAACTWRADYAGQVSLDELGGIPNYNARCHQGVLEYNRRTDHGIGTNFWNGKRDPGACALREDFVKRLFLRKYPHSPAFPEPACDWWR